MSKPISAAVEDPWSSGFWDEDSRADVALEDLSQEEVDEIIYNVNRRSVLRGADGDEPPREDVVDKGLLEKK